MPAGQVIIMSRSVFDYHISYCSCDTSDAFLTSPVCHHPERFRLPCSAFSDNLRVDEGWADPEAPRSPHLHHPEYCRPSSPAPSDCLIVGGGWANPEVLAPALHVRSHPERHRPSFSVIPDCLTVHWDRADPETPHAPHVRRHPEH